VRTIQNSLVYVEHVALLFCFSGNAQTPPKSSASDDYELTAYAGYDVMCCVLGEPKVGNSEGLTIHAFVKADAPFVFLAEDGHAIWLKVTYRAFSKSGRLASFGR